MRSFERRRPLVPESTPACPLPEWGRAGGAPERDVNRAQFAAIIVRELGIKPAVYRGQLEDVQVTDWHASYLAAANEYGVLTGYTDGTARPLNPITREEAMAMVARAMKIVGMLTAISPAATKASHAQFADAEGYADWSQNAAVVIQKA